MAMENLKHFSHECDLTSPEIVRNNICNICYKDEPIECACESCNFDICKVCSELPQKVFHDFHHKHPLVLCLYKYDRIPEHIICSGCGNMCSGSYYGCETCEIYLDLGCACMANIIKGWDIEEMLHDSHAHLLKRCRPGPDAKGSCLLCELPIQHPLHSAHSLKRASYIRTCGERVTCSACKLKIVGGPYSCLECNIDLHLRCADSLLRGLLHKSHEHRLFYVATNARLACDLIKEGKPCQICKRTRPLSLDCCYHCVECDLMFHFECLDIPEYVVRKSYHIHPLVCKIFRGKDGSLEYCDVCETMVHEGHHAYSCEECDFLGHIECILREEEPSPLYLKDLYSCGEDVTGVTDRDNEKKKIGIELIMVNDVIHIHTMRPIHMSELGESANCIICYEAIHGSPYKCTTCSFQAHHFCTQLGQSSRSLVHLNHPLTLLPVPPIGKIMSCDNCRKDIRSFNLFCRICNFIIDIRCTLKCKQSLGVLGQKIIGKWKESCITTNKHSIVQVLVSSSYMTACAICSEKMYGRALSCMTCGEIYHPQCMKVWRQGLFPHPLHSNHRLAIKDTSRYECIACKKSIAKYGYNCYICRISFHIDCIKSVNIPRNIKSHIHYLYNFWMDNLRLTRVCSVCARPCGASFYGCVDCNFNAHVECLGMATYVRNQLHQHSVVHGNAFCIKNCPLCGSECSGQIYYCNYCGDMFHVRCLLSMADREIATEAEQLHDIYLMYIERDLFHVLQV